MCHLTRGGKKLEKQDSRRTLKGCALRSPVLPGPLPHPFFPQVYSHHILRSHQSHACLPTALALTLFPCTLAPPRDQDLYSLENPIGKTLCVSSNYKMY